MLVLRRAVKGREVETHLRAGAVSIEDEQRAAIVAEAMTWLGTPYFSNGNLKGVGVDCAMILIEVFSAVGLIEHFDPRPYPTQWAMHQKKELYLELVMKFAAEVESRSPGDVVLFQFGHCWAHGGIVTKWPELLHANPPGVCRLVNWTQNSALHKRRPRFFSYWAKKDK